MTDPQTKQISNILVKRGKEWHAPDRMILTIVGDVKTAAAIDAVKRYFGDWPKHGNLAAPVIPNTAVPAGPERMIVIPVPDKAQVDVLYGFPGLLKRHDRLYGPLSQRSWNLCSGIKVARRELRRHKQVR